MSQETQGQTQKPAAPPESKDHDQWAKRRRAFNEKIVNKIARDPRFRQALLDDSGAALRSAGLDRELLELEKHDLEAQPGTAARECVPASCVGTCNATCRSNTCLFTTGC